MSSSDFITRLSYNWQAAITQAEAGLTPEALSVHKKSWDQYLGRHYASGVQNNPKTFHEYLEAQPR